MHWDVVDIVETVTEGLRNEAAARDREQAVYSIDALDELGLHPLIHQPLQAAGYGIWPEQRYPADRSRRRRKSDAKRCDLVLSPDDLPLVDPEAEQTLFAPPESVPLEGAFWLEIKTVAQFTTEGPFPHYSKELLQPVTRDIRKLAQDPFIRHAGLLLVLFTADEATADHDLGAWEQRAIAKGYPVGPPIIRRFPLTDRLGNATATVALATVRRL